MLPGVFTIPAFAPAAAAATGKFIDIIGSLDLNTGLRLCLDAGDAASYTSGQSWLDRSGNGHDFFLGASGSASGDDPAFNGSAGGLSASEYFSFDGGDNFRYDTTNETWMQDLHKNNAEWSFAAWIQAGGTGTQSVFGTNGGGGATGTGVHLRLDGGSNTAVLAVASSTLAFTSSFNVSPGAWTFIGILLSEPSGAGGSLIRVNTGTQTFNGTYSSPATGNASQTFEIGARGNGNSRLTSGSRMAGLMMWSSIIGGSQLTALFEATRGRFGI